MLGCILRPILDSQCVWREKIPSFFCLSLRDGGLKLVLLVLWQMVNKLCKFGVIGVIVLCQQGAIVGDTELSCSQEIALAAKKINALELFIMRS